MDSERLDFAPYVDRAKSHDRQYEADIDIYFGWKHNAGLIVLTKGMTSLHLAVHPKYWLFGYKQDWYDGPIHNYGFGPLFLFNYLEE